MDSEEDNPVQERPRTTGGRIFGNISEDLHNKIQNPKNLKMTNIDLPSSCICREEITRLQLEMTK